MGAQANFSVSEEYLNIPIWNPIRLYKKSHFSNMNQQLQPQRPLSRKFQVSKQGGY